MKKTTLALASLCLATSAMADSGGASASDARLQVLSFADLRAACENPARFHNQIAPTNIQVTCRDMQYKWVPDENGSFQMPTARHVTVSVMSDKYKTKSITGPVGIETQLSSCARYKQVAELVETVRPTTCEELIAYQGTAIEFCTTAVNALRTDNVNAIQIRETGNTIDSCGTTSGRSTRALGPR